VAFSLAAALCATAGTTALAQVADMDAAIAQWHEGLAAVPGEPGPAGRGEPSIDCTINEVSGCQSFEFPRVAGTSLLSGGAARGRIADHFITANVGMQSLTRACWWGTYGVGCGLEPPASIDDFQITYYARNADGTPGTVLGQFRQRGCPCDFNADGVLNSQDYFDFLTCFFGGGCPAGQDADYNNDTLVNSQDYFDFLVCFFAPPASCSNVLTVTRRHICDSGNLASTEFTGSHAAVELAPDTCYFIEIINFTDGTQNWFWSRTAPATDGFCLRDANSDGYVIATDSAANDRAFCVNVELDVFGTGGRCFIPPPPICENPDTNGHPFDSAVNFGGFSASPSANAVGNQIADAFQVETDGNITDVCFRGFWVAQNGTQPSGPTAPEFDITYFANDAALGQPGAVLAAHHVGDPGVNVFREGFRYRIEHPPVAVTAGVCYYISISIRTEFADPNFNLRFAWWLTSDGTAMPPVGDNVTHSRAAGGATPGAWFYQQFGDPAIANIHFLLDHGPTVRPTCPGPTGACCVGQECAILSALDCLAASGVFRGVGTNCDLPGECGPPPNDSCAAPTVIVGEGTFPFDNRNATFDAPAACATSGRDIWFSWTAPCSGDFIFQACGLALGDTVLSVHTDCVSPSIACDDDGCGGIGVPSTTTFTATGGTTYLLRVSHWSAMDGGLPTGEVGSFSINRTPSPCP
jgi:hypothetical protein